MQDDSSFEVLVENKDTMHLFIMALGKENFRKEVVALLGTITILPPYNRSR